MHGYGDQLPIVRVIQLELMSMQPLLIRAQIRHGACLSKTKPTYGK
jgi:hypothetical protein